jgi:hypothetical protein
MASTGMPSARQYLAQSLARGSALAAMLHYRKPAARSSVQDRGSAAGHASQAWITQNSGGGSPR